MTIYYLRHEDRPLEDSTFYIELSKLGKRRARTSLKSLLLQLDLNEIYCSPFIRCLQTINPFIQESGKIVNVDYGLQEFFFDKNFIKKSKAKLSLDEMINFNVNQNYKSTLKPNTLKYQEDFFSLNQRVDNFANDVLKKYINSEKNILVCTHMGVLNVLISKMSNIERDPNDFYSMGSLSKIENNQIVFLN